MRGADDDLDVERTCSVNLILMALRRVIADLVVVGVVERMEQGKQVEQVQVEHKETAQNSASAGSVRTFIHLPPAPPRDVKARPYSPEVGLLTYFEQKGSLHIQ